MPTPRPAPDPDGTEPTENPNVPLTLLSEVLHSVAAALHDRPVQSLVAGRLLVETGLAPGPHEEVLTRGIAALDGAAEQTRDLMWALDGTVLRPSHLATDIADAVARGAGPDRPVEVSVTLDDAGPAEEGCAAAVAIIVQALHEILVDVLLAGGHALSVSVLEDAEALHARLVTAPATAGTDAGPWVQLATARLAAGGGAVATTVQGATRTVRLRLPNT